MKTISASSMMANTLSARLRFIALSASVPNIDDISVWLKVSKSATKKFSDEWRPVKVLSKLFLLDINVCSLMLKSLVFQRQRMPTSLIAT